MDASNWWMPGGNGDSPPNQWPSQDPIDWRYPPYIRPSFQAYVRGYPHSSYGQTYGTNVPPSVGSWRSPIEISHESGPGTITRVKRSLRPGLSTVRAFQTGQEAEFQRISLAF